MQVFNIDRDIDSRLREQEAIRQTFIRAASIKQDSVQESQAGRYDDKYMKLLELSEVIDNKIDGVAEKRIEITRNIDKVDDVIYRSLLRDRYLNHMTWESIAESTNQSARNATRVHGRALQEFYKANEKVVDEHAELKAQQAKKCP